MPQLITSLTNPRIKHVVTLRDKKTRDADGLMLIEGYDDLSLALACLPNVRALFYCPELFKIADGAARAFRATCAGSGAELIEVSEPVFRKIAYRDGPDGWLAVAPQPDFSLVNLTPTRANPLIILAERVEKPGNLGAILRTADAAGADAVIVCDPIADLTNPNVVRASIGALFSVPVATATNAETLAWLRARNIAIVATTPAASQPFTAVDLTGPIAILVGEEKYGLSKFWLEQADMSVLIPMAGKVNSLNVSVSAALLVYEAVKQRAAAGPQTAR